LKINNVPIAFFDLDETLTSKDTNSLWMEWRKRRDFKVILEFIVGLHNVYYYKRGRLTPRKINLYYRARTLGMNPSVYLKKSSYFFNEYGRHYLYSDAVKLIEAHRNKRIHTVIITAQDNIISENFYEFLKADGLVSNTWIINNNRYNGFKDPNCYGDGKIILAREYAERRNIRLEDCSFYSDSISDLPLLKEVKYPNVINPGKELLQIAENLKWDVHNFRELYIHK